MAVGKIYRNSKDVILEIVEVLPGRLQGKQVLGTVYLAVDRDAVFGDRQLYVTPAGLEECGYQEVEQ